MAHDLVRSYDDFSAAEAAREALLQSGFPAEAVHLTVRDDEAGPVEGNFVAGNGKRGPTGWIDALKGFGTDKDYTYEHNFADSVQRGVYLLTVDADDDQLRSLAGDILARSGAVDVNERLGRAAR
ncbi:hypothetical protein [Caldimonas brevitalea]|uniref:Uncharacterized protein n=1 Tax=Caldimonas brevitalea TaxID=413882 RepID=A0A0G3BDZ8_9BURK|nr:hypothetical protein [Caldimonas brevitalea]AKJ27517.1 hypothetical protein AAW51_0826 [Caldimonas brevitalea]